MPVNLHFYQELKAFCKAKMVTLVAVSKTKPIEDILELYHLGQRDFGENYVQELTEKYAALPKDIRWHFIGHLQTNKVKIIAPFISLIQSVDSEKLFSEINKQGAKNNRVIDCLLQIFIAREETKFGLDENELKMLTDKIHEEKYQYATVKGLMGMASFTKEKEQVKNEFCQLNNLSKKYFGKSINGHSPIISMGMSADYELAIDEGSNLIRVGSLLFGERQKK